MNFGDLLKAYKKLQKENDELREELSQLKHQQPASEVPDSLSYFHEDEISIVTKVGSDKGIIFFDSDYQVNKHSESHTKVNLFMSLFRGRDDVFARRWENRRKGSSGYSPACENEWKPQVCRKPQISCSDCKNRKYIPLDEKTVENHLRGVENFVAGIYPLLPDDTCWFLAIDFDETGWQKDVSVLRETCSLFDIPVAIERSRSGNGAHAWFFFDKSVPASFARKLGSALLTHAMSKRHEISFKSYDRFFPCQDTMPRGGFGNLIALPLQKEARKQNNSVFINDRFEPYEDQWAFLASIQRLSSDRVDRLVNELCKGNDLGILKKEEEDSRKPWESIRIELKKRDFPKDVEIVKANMLFVRKTGISERGLNRLKRLAAFKNPEFYKAQAMRMPTFNKPRIISCSEETDEYLCLPRGCEEEMNLIFNELVINVLMEDKTNNGQSIHVRFLGNLRDEQPLALNNLLEHQNGLLSGTTAFGKTVTAISLIAERRVNTLILVNRINLVSQWKEKLIEFLEFDHFSYPMTKEKSFIGQFGRGKQNLTGMIDIALLQSLSREVDEKEFLKEYGMVIVDECHHVPAFSFEAVLKKINAKYVYGLTATPARKDGHHPIIFMQCGPVRFRDDARKQAGKRPFGHFIIPRFTTFRTPKSERDEITVQELYGCITADEVRNQMIADDVIQCCKNNRNCLVLTERKNHVTDLAKKIGTEIPDVITVTGGMGTKNTRENHAMISGFPKDKPLVIVSTGRYIGEGFDEPRLDTLFLAMPVSWKGTLAQYAGRLHRLFEGKREAIIYDYVDIHVRMFENMYHKRLSGYASIGYKVKDGVNQDACSHIIFDKTNFLPVFSNDILNAKNEILIVSPYLTLKRTTLILKELNPAISKQVKVRLMTRPSTEPEGKGIPSWSEAVRLLEETGINLIFRKGIHQKFALIDQRIVWYGSINLLGYGSSEETMMRIESTAIAFELVNSIEK